MAVSTASIIIRLSEAPALTLATYRLGLSALVMLPYFLYAEGYKKWDRRDVKLFLLTSLFLAFHFIFWISSLRYTSILNSTILVTLNPSL
ncbi:EamA family transporter [Candidatus Hakubella thermalkaliphila]|uniref:EamA family transporter n=1 Tax=Candidatus Hakubella thermalkaliphila TaxID=2754717 RepID=UPI00387E37E0